jgi:probable HAF family extracellular repeat protein
MLSFQFFRCLGNLGITFGAAILAVPTLANAGAVPTYTVTDLGVLKGSSESISGELNNQGLAIGTAVEENDQAVLFLPGKIVVNLDASAPSSFASDINSQGKITGYFYTGSKWNGFTWNNGSFSAFSAPGAIDMTPESLNDVGQIAGYFEDASLNDHIFIRQANGSYQDLGSNFGIDPSALAINNQGRVLIGTSLSPESTMISRPGSTSMELVPSLIPNGAVSPGDMNQAGVVTGSAGVDTQNDRQHAFLYFQGQIKDLGLLPGGDMTIGEGINNFNQVVGTAYQFAKPILNSKGVITGYTPEIQHGWVYLNGQMVDLNGALNTVGKSWVIVDAVSINDHGQILADAIPSGGQVSHAVLLVPNVFMP